MFFREKKIKKSRLTQLVESYRDREGRPRQRILASLGDARLSADMRRRIVLRVRQRLQGQRDLFDGDLRPVEAEWVDRIAKIVERTRSVQREREVQTLDGVVADKVDTINVVEFGPELVGMAAWRALGLTEQLSELGLNSRAVSIAQSMVINRLVEPLSEWALIEWLEHTALPECLNVRVTKTTKDRLYKTSDEILAHRRKLEEYLRGTEAGWFDKPGSIVLYDVTNTHFEGLCATNPKAARGKNKQKRNDCLQVAVGMAFDEHGLALAHEVFEGNICDAKTLVQMLDRFESYVGAKATRKPVIILDAGVATDPNLQELKNRGYSYLVNITRGRRATYAQEFNAGGFLSLPRRDSDEQVQVKTIAHPDMADDRLVLCRSMKRREKELAMISKAEKRFVEDVEALRTRVDCGRLKDPEKILKKIGGLLAKHPRVARFHEVTFSDGKISLSRDDSGLEVAYGLCGDYVLRTDQQFQADELWTLYMTLLKAEAGFKMLKGTLGLRPNFHQKEFRVDGHIFITVLAYHLLCWIHNRLEAAGDRRTWRTIRRLLKTHCLLTTCFPMEDGRIISIRKASVPDEEQIRIYNMLGINWKSAFSPRKTERKS